MIELLAVFFLITPQALQDAPESTTDCSHIKPLLSGDNTVCDGLLVPEARYTRFLNAEIQVDDYKGKLRLKELYIKELEDLYAQAIRPHKIPWYRRLSFNRVVFYTLGLVTAALSIYGGTQLVKAANN